MKFDPFKWHEVKANEKTQVPQGTLRVLASGPCPLFVEAEGHTALVGYGTSWDVETTSKVIFWTETASPVRVFYYAPRNAVQTQEGEIFTNIDRLPGESGNLSEVQRGARALELMRRQMMQEMRLEHAKLRAAYAPKAAAPAVEVIEEEEAAPE